MVSPLLGPFAPAAYVALDISSSHLDGSLRHSPGPPSRTAVLGICVITKFAGTCRPIPLLEGQLRSVSTPCKLPVATSSPPQARAFAGPVRPAARAPMVWFADPVIGISPGRWPGLEAAYNVPSRAILAAFASNLLVRAQPLTSAGKL